MRIADQYAHRRMSIKVLGAARLRDGTGLLYVRRSEDKAWASGHGGYLFDMLRLDAKTGAWTTVNAQKAMVAFMTSSPVGTIGRAGNRNHVEVICPRDLHTGGVLVVQPPDGGWLWDRGTLSADEQANVDYNFGRA